MPELPEVETLRRSLEPRVLGRRITAAALHRRDVLVLPDDPAHGRPRRVQPAHLLVDARIGELRRRGKQLAVIASDGRTLVVHLGMSGRVLHAAKEQPRAPHQHATWSLDDGSVLTFIDPRRFGGLWFLPSTSDLEARWSALGPDGLGLTAAELAAASHGSRRAIKAVLLDQRRIAGVGNIYADEALFAAGIRPGRRAATLMPTDHDRLSSAIRRILAQAVRARGSTLRDYTDAAGQSGEAQLSHRVYGRAGKPCTQCTTLLSQTQLAQRTTVYCRTCQR